MTCVRGLREWEVADLWSVQTQARRGCEYWVDTKALIFMEGALTAVRIRNRTFRKLFGEYVRKFCQQGEKKHAWLS